MIAYYHTDASSRGSIGTAMRAAIYTLGCKLNQCESEGLADAFSQQGFTVTSPSEDADLYIVNTCTVTSKAEQKARRMIRRYARLAHQPVVIVTGCYAQLNGDDIAALAERLHVVSLDKKSSLLMMPAYIASLLSSGVSLQDAVSSFISDDLTESSPFDYRAITFVYHARAFLKIEDGCDNACAYCRVTLARGKAVSLDVQEVIRRCLEIEAQGYREIVFTGVNITAYASQGRDLAALLQAVLDALSRRVSIRLSSLEPDMITDRLIEVCRDPRVQPHFHIPLQSASDEMLTAVNRHYSVELAARQIRRLMAVKDDAFLAADIITGLPGERDSDHQRTLQFLKDLGFSRVHVFPFSPRPGTALFDAPHKVPEYLRDERAGEIRRLSTKLYGEYVSRWQGRTVDVIIEGMFAGAVQGITDNYLKVSITALPGDPEQARGRLCRARLSTEGDVLTGTFVEFA
jgi:threonylcarbamoyladenosine tRNA methylthiotransferase MtaB